MEILHLKALNFKNYTNMDIYFKELHGLSIIQGHNGAGKTSILDAICYALYGKTSIGITGDAVVNRLSNSNTVVELEFSIGNDIYTIKRYRKDKKHKNEVLLFMNNDDITLPSIKGTNTKIEEIIGVPYNIFLSSVLFNSTSVDLFINSTDKNRKDLLEKLLGVGIFKDALELVKNDIKEKTSERESISTSLNTMKLAKEQEDSLMENYKMLLHNYENKEKSLKEHINNLSDVLNNSKSVSDIENQITQIDNKINKENDSMISSDTTKRMNSLYSQKNSIETKIANIKTTVTQDKELIQNNKNEFIKLKNSKNPTCKYCGNVLDDSHKKSELQRLADEAKSKSSEIESLKAPYNQYVNTLSDINNEINSLQDKVENEKKLQLKHQQCINELMDTKSSLKIKLHTIQQNINDLNSSKKELTELQNNPILKPKSSFDMSKYEKLIKDNDSLKKELDTLEQVKVIYGNKGIKNSYISSSIPVINAKLDEYLSILSDDAFTASIKTKVTAKNGNVSNSINLVIDYPSRNGEIKFTELSSGEKRLVSLAINLAFNYYLNNNTPFNTLFLDEVLDTLSSNRIENVFKLLNKLKSDYANILLISHVDEIKDNPEIDNVINIEHDNKSQASLVIGKE